MSLRILLVDDEEIVHATIGEYLRDLGHEVDDEMDGQEGLEALQQQDYDLALVDISMPRMDGLELLQAAAATRLSTPILIVTGLGDTTLAQRVLRLGARGLLYKPIRLRDLAPSLEALCP